MLGTHVSTLCFLFHFASQPASPIIAPDSDRLPLVFGSGLDGREIIVELIRLGLFCSLPSGSELLLQLLAS